MFLLQWVHVHLLKSESRIYGGLKATQTSYSAVVRV